MYLFITQKQGNVNAKINLFFKRVAQVYHEGRRHVRRCAFNAVNEGQEMTKFIFIKVCFDDGYREVGVNKDYIVTIGQLPECDVERWKKRRKEETPNSYIEMIDADEVQYCLSSYEELRDMLL